MAINIGGVVSGDAFPLGSETNKFDAGTGDRTAAETLRDDYATANPLWLAEYDADSSLNIVLLYVDGANNVALYQRREAGNWVDNTSSVAVRGPSGAGTDFSGITENHIPAIGPSPNYYPYDSGLFVDPETGDVTTGGSLQTGPSSIRIGPIFTLSSGVEAVALTLGNGEKALGVNVEYDDTGSTHPFYYKLGAETPLNVNTTSDTIFADPFEVAYTTFNDNLTVDFDIVPAEAGELRVRFYEGTDDTGPLIFDEKVTVEAADVDSPLHFGVGNPYLFATGTDIFVNFSGIQLKGGIAAPTDLFAGQSSIYFKSYVNSYTKVDFLTTENGSDDLLNQSSVTGTTVSDALVWLYNNGMLKSIYDPTNVEGDVYDMDNMVESTTAKILTNTERTKLSGIEDSAEVNNISDVNATDLTDGGESTLHYHESDRDRSNHTGTQLSNTISDFDTRVGNNSSVQANTAKVTNATHTGEVTGDTALTVQPEAITNQTLVDAAPGQLLLVEDSGVLRKVDADDFLGADFGTKLYYAESLPQSTTTSSWVTKVTLNLPSDFSAGDYFIEVNFGWRISSTSNDFQSRVQLDGNNLDTLNHFQESKDSNNRHSNFRRYKRTLPAGAQTITLDYGRSGGSTAYIWDASITVQKIQNMA